MKRVLSREVHPCVLERPLWLQGGNRVAPGGDLRQAVKEEATEVAPPVKHLWLQGRPGVII